MSQSFNIRPSFASESCITHQAIDNFRIVVETVQEHIVISSKSMNAEPLYVSILFEWSEVAFAYAIPDMFVRVVEGLDVSKVIYAGGVLVARSFALEGNVAIPKPMPRQGGPKTRSFR
jgi:hypothetical protein